MYVHSVDQPPALLVGLRLSQCAGAQGESSVQTRVYRGSASLLIK
jgi:hypothetical protein